MDWIKQRSVAFGGLIKRHQLSVFIISSIVIGTMLVVVAMVIYTVSGSLQLDLSRPGFEAVRKDIARPDSEAYSPTGPLSRDSVDEFLILYDEQLEDINTIDAFGGDVLSESTLGIDDTSSPEE